MSDDRKFCADCRFYNGSWNATCSKWGRYDLVSGGFSPQYAKICRDDYSGRCGSEARGFEPKPTIRERLEVALVAGKLVLLVLLYLPKVLFRIAKSYIKREKKDGRAADVPRVSGDDVRDAEEAGRVDLGVIPETRGAPEAEK